MPLILSFPVIRRSYLPLGSLAHDAPSRPLPKRPAQLGSGGLLQVSWISADGSDRVVPSKSVTHPWKCCGSFTARKAPKQHRCSHFGLLLKYSRGIKLPATPERRKDVTRGIQIRIQQFLL